MITIVITRHAALIAYARELGILKGNPPVVSHATAEQVRGQHVLGILPLYLAAEAATVTEIPLALTLEDREQGELSIERVRQIAGAPRTYTVSRIDPS